MLTPWKESYDQPRQQIKKQRHYFVNKGLSSQGYGFSSGHVWMWELDCEESWAPKNWCFRTVVLEKTLELCRLWKHGSLNSDWTRALLGKARSPNHCSVMEVCTVNFYIRSNIRLSKSWSFNYHHTLRFQNNCTRKTFFPNKVFC